MAKRNGIYKINNGNGYDEVYLKTIASQIIFDDDENLQQKLDNGSLSNGSSGSDLCFFEIEDGYLTCTVPDGESLDYQVNENGELEVIING